MFRRYRRRLRIWETDFGRDAGWIGERDGKPVAQLIHPRFVDMADLYHFVPMLFR